MAKLKNRVGEKYITNEGYEIEIIEYFSSINCTIRFKDGHLIFNRKYNHIKKGTICNMKVIKFKLNGKIFTLNEEDGKYYSPDGNWANYVSMLNDEVLEFREKR